MADSFGYKEASPHYCQIMVAKREKVDRLTHKNQHAQGVPPSPYRYEGGRTSSPPKNCFFDVLDENGLLKPTDKIGQPEHHKLSLKAGQLQK